MMHVTCESYLLLWLHTDFLAYVIINLICFFQLFYQMHSCHKLANLSSKCGTKKFLDFVLWYGYLFERENLSFPLQIAISVSWYCIWPPESKAFSGNVCSGFFLFHGFEMARYPWYVVIGPQLTWPKHPMLQKLAWAGPRSFALGRFWLRL